MRRYLLHITIALLSAFAGTAQAQIVDTVCAQGGPSSLGVNGQFSSSSFDWHISGGSILAGQGSSSVLIAWPQVQGVYSAYVVETSNEGCVGDTVTAQIYVTEPNTTYITGPTRVCQGEYVELQANDHKTTGKFLWSTGDTSDIISFIAHRDTVIFRVAVNKACENDTVFHFLEVLPTPVVNVSTDALSDTVSFNTYVNFLYTGSETFDIQWIFNGVWIGAGESIDLLFSEPGWNEIQSIAINGMCSDTLTHQMYVEDELKMHIPNAFSPNGDGLNDLWVFDGLGFDEYEVRIYDRWGQLMAQWDNEHPGSWDGTFQGSQAVTGAYTYRIKVMTINNQLKHFAGSITLIR